MPALDWITVKGFKSLKNVEKLELQNVNVIIGANGSGKSNFISTFSFLHALRQGLLTDTVKRLGGADDILYRGRRETDTVTFRLSFDDERNQYEIRLVADERNRLIPLKETAFFWDKSRGYPHPYEETIWSDELEAGISKPQTKSVPVHVQKHLAKWRLYHFHDTSSNSPLKLPSDVNDNRHLRADGSNIASVLYLFREKHPTSYKMIVNAIRDVAPFFDDFILEPLELNTQKISLEWKEVGHDKYMPPSAFSDGTLRFIALAALLLQPALYIPSVILIDEPELGLHPYALQVLASLIGYASKSSQIIVSTQSAFFLDNFEPANVLVADRIDGETVFNRLNSEMLGNWLEEYSLGQLWEKAELGGRPR